MRHLNHVSRRQFITVAGATAALGFMGCSTGRFGAGRGRDDSTMYVGTYTDGRSDGVYVVRMSPTSGHLTMGGLAARTTNPSFLAPDTTRRHLYAVNEVVSYEGQSSGSVTAFRIDSSTGALREINQQASRGGAPCYITVDRANRFVMVANYSGGNASVLPIAADGSLGAAVTVVQHSGSGPNPQRQQAPHAHSVIVAPDNRFAFVADLGIDRIMVYRYDDRTGALTPGDPPAATLAPGAGPRHFTFHPDARRAYVINELDSTVSAFDYEPRTGALGPVQTVSTLPAGYDGQNSCADIHVHPSGRFLYGSNRGHDSIVVYAIAPGTGSLSLVQHQSTMGRTPRNFAIDPTGRFLLAANQDSDSIAVFAIDSVTGRLTHTGQVLDVPAPVCLRFV
jgi:6-phosphogluconolactonase